MAERPPCYDRAVGLLARRPHFRAQLEAKLVARDYPPGEIAEALDRLTRHGYLDDLGAARDFVALKQRRGPYGPRRLRADLERRGADGEAVDTVLDEAFADGDLEPARKAARKWSGRRGGKGPQALARYLDRRGFTQGAVLTVLEEAEGC